MHSSIYVTKTEKKIPISVYINQNCNLNCNSCIRCAPLFDHEEYPLDIFERDLKRIHELFKKSLLTIDGGEPLLNKNLLEYLKIGKKYCTQVEIITNGILIPKLSKETLEYIRDNGMFFLITCYPGINYSKTFETLAKYNITYLNSALVIKKLFSNTDKLLFQYNRLSLKKINKNYAFNNCRECVGVLNNGKFYKCGKPIISKKLNEIYGTNFEVKDEDYIDIFKIKNFDDFYNFFSKSSEFCSYCKDKIRNPKKNTFEWNNFHKGKTFEDLKIEFIEN